MWRRFWFKPFEAFVGIFVIINGLLTMFPIAEGGSAVKDNLWNLLGYTGIAIPFFQLLAGTLKIVGIALSKANLEASGLIMVGSIFLIRGLSLVTDGDITNSDINNVVIAVGIVICNIIRLSQVTNNHKYIVNEQILTQRP
jgi:hypothetical protein